MCACKLAWTTQVYCEKFRFALNKKIIFFLILIFYMKIVLYNIFVILLKHFQLDYFLFNEIFRIIFHHFIIRKKKWKNVLIINCRKIVCCFFLWKITRNSIYFCKMFRMCVYVCISTYRDYSISFFNILWIFFIHTYVCSVRRRWLYVFKCVELDWITSSSYLNIYTTHRYEQHHYHTITLPNMCLSVPLHDLSFFDYLRFRIKMNCI